MEIRISHRFPCTAREYWETTRGQAFEDDIRRETETDVTVLERTETGDVLRERVRISPRKELPAVMQKALGAPRLSYVQEMVSDTARLTIQWNIVMDVMPDKVRCSGTTRFVELPGGCERVIEGEIRVLVPLVGGTMEKHVLDGIVKSYERAAEVARRHIARRATS
ncbi:MAG: DUF2505 family protein [Myxococcota bacterium]